MNALAALAMIAPAAQGPIGPVGPVGPIDPGKLPIIRTVDLIGNGGFEGSSASPWSSTVLAGYKLPSTGQSFKVPSAGGQRVFLKGHQGLYCYRLTAGPLPKPDWVWTDSSCYLQQTLSLPTHGYGAILSANAWVRAAGAPLYVRVTYTTGGPTYASTSFSGSVWTQWDFRSAIDASRTMTRIEFFVDTSFDDPLTRTVDIDDVSVVAIAAP